MSGNLSAGQSLYVNDAGGNTNVNANGGSFTNGGSITLDGSVGGVTFTIASGTMTNTGTITTGAVETQVNLDGTVVNQGTIAAPASLLFNDGLTNEGTLNVGSAGSATFDNDALVQSAGSTTLGGGSASVIVPDGMTLSGGTLEGAGTITGDVTNGGTVNPSPSPSTMSISGSYTQQSSGYLEVGATSSGNDQLVVSGTAALDGTLQVNQASGFTPTVEQTFEILHASAVTGQFATTAGLASGPYSVTYDPADVTLTALTPPPQALTVPVAGSGSGRFRVPMAVSPACAGQLCSRHPGDVGHRDARSRLYVCGLERRGLFRTGSCTVPMSRARSVTATFDSVAPTSPTLTASIAGTGSGSVASGDGGRLVPGHLLAQLCIGRAGHAHPTAASGSTFAGWSGANCSGTGTCTLTMSAAQSVTATFTSTAPPTISINDVSVVRSPSTSVPATFTVSLSSAAASAVTVDYATSNGTASSPADYTAALGQVTFAPGQTQTTIIVNVAARAPPPPRRPSSSTSQIPSARQSLPDAAPQRSSTQPSR